LFHDGTGDDLRSAAVRSLQKQKARQTIASRLEKASTSSRNNFQQDHNGIHPVALSAAATTTTTPSLMDLDPVVETTHNKRAGFTPFDDGEPPPSFSSAFGFTAKKRQSTVFGKLDPSLMEELTAGLDDTDFNDDDDDE
jgi:hypothetical protein